jgi:UDP:flavonoid glycosyltransferase YjiC (YdhE family)
VTIARSVDVAGAPQRFRKRATRPDGSVDEAAVTAAMLELYAELARDAAADLVPFVRTWRPDVVLGDPLTLVAPIAAAQAGAPLVRHLWGPDVMRAFRFLGSGAPLRYWPDSLRRLYESHDCEPRVESGVATVDPCPAGLQIGDIPGRLAMRFIPYNGANVIPPSVLSRPARRRVLVTWGTALVRREGIGKFPVAGVIRAALDCDAEVVVAVAAADRRYVDEVPGVTVVENVPLTMILPTCDAIVHHGASGTLLTAACHGVPQVAVPATPDVQAYCAALFATGAGVGLAPTGETRTAITEAVSTALTGDKVRSAADALRAEIAAQPLPADVVVRLERLAAGAPTPGG